MKKVLKYLIPITLGLVVTLWVIIGKGIFQSNDPKTIIHILSDAFIVPGVCITGIGLLIFVSNEGVFDIIIYGVGQFVKMFSSNPAKRKYKDFNEYREVKRSSKLTFGYLVLIGLAFLVIALIFAIIWLNM